MFSRIRTKILALFILNVVVWLSFLGIVFYWIASRSLETQLEDSLEATASVLASQWDGSLLAALKPGMENTVLYRSFMEKLQRLKQQTDLNAITIVSRNRTNILSTDRRMRIGQTVPRLELLEVQFQNALQKQASSSRLIQVNEHYYKSATAPVYSDNQPVAVLMVDISPRYLAYMSTFKNSLLLLALIALTCCILTAHFFSRSITTPISQMVDGVEQISKANYQQPLKTTGSDELSHLANSIETMRQSIFHRDMQMKMMLTGIAHEIRNPLGGIELFSGILAKEPLNPEQRNYLERIQSEIQNLKQVLNEFLEYSRPKDLQNETIPLTPLLSEVQTIFSNEIQEKGVEWKVEIQPGIEHIYADRSRMKRVLLNLYKNALQAVPKNHGKIYTNVHKNGSGLLLEISNDQQAAIDPQVSRKIFEPFFTTKEKGIGLGLPLAKGIIEAHGGQLKLAENGNSRITFAICLPEKSEL